MTTIAYKDGELATDSRVTENGNVYTDRQRKVHKLRDGRIVAWAGSLTDSKRFLAALRKGTHIPKVDVNAIMLHPEGGVAVFDENTWLPMNEPHYAMGSGADLALGAMDAGATAKEAVKIAIKRDTNSGGRVQSLKLEK